MLKPMRCAAYTLQRDEAFHLPQWISYYSSQFDMRDLYVLDHESTEQAVVNALREFANGGGNVVTVGHGVIFDHDWMIGMVHAMQAELLGRYEYVLFSDTDEMVVPTNGSLREFVATCTDEAYRCSGFEVIEGRMARHGMYDKTLLTRIPLVYIWGYHTAHPEVSNTGELILYHLHRMDFEQAWAKNQRWVGQRWDPRAIGVHSTQNQITDEVAFREWFHGTPESELVPHDTRLQSLLEAL